MTEVNKRIQFLDISKGIGMMMIVWMHIWGNKPIGFTPLIYKQLYFNILRSIISHTFRISYQNR